jgi:ABC-type tungstate transport system substrate-binding protein
LGQRPIVAFAPGYATAFISRAVGTGRQNRAPPMDTITRSLQLAFDLIAGADARLFAIVGLSLRVSSSACLIAALGGLGLGAFLAAVPFRGRRVAVGFVNTLLALPPVVVGLVVYLMLSRSGPLGSFGILFTPAAMVVAQTILLLPLIAALARRLVVDALA